MLARGPRGWPAARCLLQRCPPEMTHCASGSGCASSNGGRRCFWAGPGLVLAASLQGVPAAGSCGPAWRHPRGLRCRSQHPGC
eukprot:1611039-Heterocapsa_arctica.AAC.1